MVSYFGRATVTSHAWLMDIPQTILHAAASHPVDSGCNRSHIHFIIETELSQKEIRKQIRTHSGLSKKMDIALKPFDPNEDWPKYMLKNPQCKYLWSSDTDIGRKLLAQSLIEVPKPSSPSEVRNSTMQSRINIIYDIMTQEQTNAHMSFSSFANEFLLRYYRDHIDEIIPGEGNINAFKSYILHAWGLYIQNHLPDEVKDRMRSRYVRLLFGQSVVDPAHDPPAL